jgi:hypothetical protein
METGAEQVDQGRPRFSQRIITYGIWGIAIRVPLADCPSFEQSHFSDA